MAGEKKERKSISRSVSQAAGTRRSPSCAFSRSRPCMCLRCQRSQQRLMSHGHLYRQWLNLCRSWGVDVSKTGRDLGEHVRTQVGIAFKDGELSRIPDASQCEEKLKSMERIANNKYYRMQDAELPTSTATTRDELQFMCSNDGIEYAKYLYDQSGIDRLKYALSMAFSRTPVADPPGRQTEDKKKKKKSS